MNQLPVNFTMRFILFLFVLLGLTASIINPLHEATDELRHYLFVRYVVQTGHLPVQGEQGCMTQAHHAPLYYLLGAAATFWVDTGPACTAVSENPFWAYRYWEVGRDNKNQYLHGESESFPWYGEALAAHLARMVNVLLGAGVVWLTWGIGRAVWPEKPALALGACALVAFNPMFVYMAGAMNNDVVAALSGSAVTLACVRLLRDEQGLSRRWGILLGGLFGLALMSKFHLVAMVVPIGAVVTWKAFYSQTPIQIRQNRFKYQLLLWLEVNLYIALLALLIAGWWFVRNQLLYGEPTGFEKVTEIWGVRDPTDVNTWGTAVFELSYAWTSLWGRFGYGQIPLPQPIYTALAWFVGLGLAGLLHPVVRFLGRKQEPEANKQTFFQVGIPVLFLLMNVGLFFAVLFSYLLVSPAGPMGRFFFPALPSLALLTFYGWAQWLEWLKLSAQSIQRAALLLNAGMLLLTVVALFGYLAPAYARPETFAAETAVPNPTNAQFDTLVNLRGYTITPTTLSAGQPLHLQLYWEVTGKPPGDYLLFVHVLDQFGNIIVQRDTHPGLGNFPSSLWQPGDRFIEDISLYLPETAYAPTQATVKIGYYALDGSYRLGITAADGTGLGDALTLAPVEVVPLPGPFTNVLQQNFNHELLLAGYEYSQRAARPGEMLAVTLYWRTLQPPTADYTVQVQLRGENGAPWEIWETADTQPAWSVGQISQDTHNFLLPSNLPPGSYIIHVALIDAVTGQAQNIVAEDGHWIDDELLLAPIKVNP